MWFALKEKAVGAKGREAHPVSKQGTQEKKMPSRRLKDGTVCNFQSIRLNRIYVREEIVKRQKKGKDLGPGKPNTLQETKQMTNSGTERTSTEGTSSWFSA